MWFNLSEQRVRLTPIININMDSDNLARYVYPLLFDSAIAERPFPHCAGLVTFSEIN